MPPPIKPKRCPACNRKMSRLGVSTAGDKPVWGCPYCLTVVAHSKKALRVPETPRFVEAKPTRSRRAGKDRRMEGFDA